MRVKLLATSVMIGMLLASSPSYAAVLEVDTGDPGCDDGTGMPYCHINAAVSNATSGDELLVSPGLYEENVVIDKTLRLLSTSGRSVTVIEGESGVGSLGTVMVEHMVDNVQIGGVNRGFTIIGIDNGNPAIENAALYFQGDHKGATVIENRITAKGDHGLLTEFGAINSDFMVSQNQFAGKTFVGEEPGGCGFAQQFSLANVPRQLVVIGGNNQNTSNITFTKNVVTGRAGGPKPDCGTHGGQGNTLVTIDAENSSVTENVFVGDTARFGVSLRAREPNTALSKNSFSSDGLAEFNCYIFVEDVDSTLGKLKGTNTYDTKPLLDPAPNATTGSVCPNQN